MKSKNRTDKTGVVAAEGKETRNAPSFSSTKGPAKLELQMGRK
jgi:adenylyl cyclase-associated protein